MALQDDIGQRFRQVYVLVVYLYLVGRYEYLPSFECVVKLKVLLGEKV